MKALLPSGSLDIKGGSYAREGATEPQGHGFDSYMRHWVTEQSSAAPPNACYDTKVTSTGTQTTMVYNIGNNNSLNRISRMIIRF